MERGHGERRRTGETRQPDARRAGDLRADSIGRQRLEHLTRERIALLTCEAQRIARRATQAEPMEVRGEGRRVHRKDARDDPEVAEPPPISRVGAAASEVRDQVRIEVFPLWHAHREGPALAIICGVIISSWYFRLTSRVPW